MSDSMSFLVETVTTGMARLEEAIPSLRWGVVTGVGPLRVQLDGDTSPLADSPDTLTAGLSVGDRVRVILVNRRAMILGRAGGAPRTSQRGSVSGGSAVAADSTNTFSVMFPVAFTAPPTVIVGSNNSRMACEAKSITATGFTLGARNVSAAATSTAVTYSWIATL